MSHARSSRFVRTPVQDWLALTHALARSSAVHSPSPHAISTPLHTTCSASTAPQPYHTTPLLQAVSSVHAPQELMSPPPPTSHLALPRTPRLALSTRLYLWWHPALCLLPSLHVFVCTNPMPAPPPPPTLLLYTYMAIPPRFSPSSSNLLFNPSSSSSST